MATPPSWSLLDIVWQASQSDIQNGISHSRLAPSWQILLLGDGSPTKHMQLLSGEKIEVDVLEMKNIGEENDGAPEIVQKIPGPRLRRQVWLRTQSGQRLAYATSWWNANQVDLFLTSHALPIWVNLARNRTELYRDIRNLFYGHNTSLEVQFDQTGPFWGRDYLFWHQGKPLTAIYEVFSPALAKFLGPSIPPLLSLTSEIERPTTPRMKGKEDGSDKSQN